MQMLQIEIPDELLPPITETDIETLARRTEALAREALMAKLYDLGHISTGRAANILGIPRRAFLEILSKHGVSEFDDSVDLAQEARIAEQARND